jgi:hypothetical protein
VLLSVFEGLAQQHRRCDQSGLDWSRSWSGLAYQAGQLDRRALIALQAFDWIMHMRMSPTQLFALVVLVLAVLLTIAEFGPAALSGLK